MKAEAWIGILMLVCAVLLGIGIGFMWKQCPACTYSCVCEDTAITVEPECPEVNCVCPEQPDINDYFVECRKLLDRSEQFVKAGEQNGWWE